MDFSSWTSVVLWLKERWRAGFDTNVQLVIIIRTHQGIPISLFLVPRPNFHHSFLRSFRYCSVLFGCGLTVLASDSPSPTRSPFPPFLWRAIEPHLAATPTFRYQNSLNYYGISECGPSYLYTPSWHSFLCRQTPYHGMPSHSVHLQFLSPYDLHTWMHGWLNGTPHNSIRCGREAGPTMVWVFRVAVFQHYRLTW